MIKVILEEAQGAPAESLGYLGSCACGNMKFYTLAKDVDHTTLLPQFCCGACKSIHETRQSWAKEFGVSL